jgi:hypothetical protein
MINTIPARWTGDGFAPMGRWAQKCNEQFVVGEIYNVEEVTERSMRSHSHYFVSVNEAWKNLPEDMMDEFPTATHLRKRGLIRCGYADQRQFVASSKAEALRMSSFIKPTDEYAVISVRECVVTVWTAQSQKLRAMGREEFQRSKDDVLTWVASLCGVTPSALAKNAREAA